MKDFIKTKWQIIVIALLFLFGLNKCTQSCNRQGVIDELRLEKIKTDSIYKSNIAILEDSLAKQNNKLDILEERVSGLKNMNEAVSNERTKTDEANKRAAESAKREKELRKQLNKNTK